MIREIVTYDIHKKDNPAVLTSPTRPVTDFKAKETLDCIQDLNDTLDELIRTEGNKRGAIGLSATQIGVDLAISAVTLGDKRYVLINPKLAEENGKSRLFRIGCFSLYEYRAMVRYNDDVVISYQDPDGRLQRLILKGDRSCVVQHEMDHLNGDLLFERLEHKKKDLFVPREALYKNGKVPLRNHGRIFELRRKLKLQKPMSAPVYYSSLFNDYTDYVAYVEKEAMEQEGLLKTVRRFTPANGDILEYGCGTGALSVQLDKEGYVVSCCQTDEDMLELAMRINEQNRGHVSCKGTEILSLPYADRCFDTIFSHEILETLDDESLVSALKEGLRTADTFVFQVPTLKIKANTLKGNERLRKEEDWLNLLSAGGFSVLACEEIDKGAWLIFAIGKQDPVS